MMRNFAYVAAWEFQGLENPPLLHKEPLVYEEVHLAQRSYKVANESHVACLEAEELG
jgi:hypothetical protein